LNENFVLAVGCLPLSSRPERQENSLPLANLGRGVEGSRRSILRHAATRNSPQNVNVHLGERSDGVEAETWAWHSLQAQDRPKSHGEWDDAWEEFPEAVWRGIGHGDPSTPRRRFSWEQDARGAAVGMTALRNLRAKMGYQGRSPGRSPGLGRYVRGNENFVLIVDTESLVRNKNLVIG
jgi:hypothetical protein